MQLVAYRNTERSARVNLAPVDKPMTIHELRVFRAREEGVDLIQIARDSARERQKREAIEAIRRGREAARRVNNRPLPERSFERIACAICKAAGVRRFEIAQSRRNRTVSFARQAVYYWAIRLTTLSIPEIGRRLGRDHSTVIKGAKAYRLKRARMGRYLREQR